MTRVALRPLPDLDATYPKAHAHHHFPDHLIRVGVSREVGRWMVRDIGQFTVADLSAGDAAIARGIGATSMILGDYAPTDGPFAYDFIGPIEETAPSLPAGSVDLFVCCETIEHLANPDTVLGWIRPATSMLLLSTPIDAWDDGNPEHVWAWDREGVEDMLALAGFTPFVYTEVDPRNEQFPYKWGIWGCK